MAEPVQALSLKDMIRDLGAQSRKASRILAQTPEKTINNILDGLAAALRAEAKSIIDANKLDLAAAKQKGLSEPMMDRLALNEARIESIARGVEAVEQLPDPVGKTLWKTVRPNGLKIERVSCPIGVLGMIYESRPNVTVDAAILCLKSRNAVILRGGSESFHSSSALHKIIQKTLENYNLPPACVSMIPTQDRDAVGEMLKARDYIDVMIPRGGQSLVERIMNEATMPVFSHLSGICHIYVHKSAKPDIAKTVTLNAKMRRTSVCGAMETLLLDKDLDQSVAKSILTNLLDSGCAIVGDKLVQGLDPRIGQATTEDWRTEYLEAKLSCCIVSNVQEAVDHINTYGSHHTDSILSEDAEVVSFFLNNVDSGIVMHNASTQFADGGEFGLGAEIGIATGKMHARGPVGLEQLCTYKYVVHGNGQTRP